MSKFLRSFVFVAIAFSFLLAACGTSATPTPQTVVQIQTQVVEITSTPGPAQPTPMAPGSVQITGAGSTFQQPAVSDWAFAYALVDPSVSINYQGVGFRRWQDSHHWEYG